MEPWVERRFLGLSARVLALDETEKTASNDSDDVEC